MYMFQKDLTMLSGTVGVFFVDLLIDLVSTKYDKGDTLENEKSIKALCNQ